MTFLPFYIPANKKLKVVIVGGGYAGISALTTLTRYSADIDIILIDPRLQHLKLTHLHETFRYPLSDLLVPFTYLEGSLGCRHLCAALTLTDDTLRQWQTDKSLVINGEVISFDYLVISVGSESRTFSNQEKFLELQDFTETSGSDLLIRHLKIEDGNEQCLSVLGGGATGIEFLFEVHQFLHRQKINCKLRLIDSGKQILSQFPVGFATYVRSRMQEMGIDFYPDTDFHAQQVDQVKLEDKKTGELFFLPSDITLAFPGREQKPKLATNSFGQVMVDSNTLPNIFSAGDCSHFNFFGSNALVAQSAVRKGKLVGRNILRHSGRLKILEPYLHQDIGYVVSLGSGDAVGWLVAKGNVVTGLPALVIKEVVETQYDLLLMGIDTYVI